MAAGAGVVVVVVGGTSPSRGRNCSSRGSSSRGDHRSSDGSGAVQGGRTIVPSAWSGSGFRSYVHNMFIKAVAAVSRRNSRGRR